MDVVYPISQHHPKKLFSAGTDEVDLSALSSTGRLLCTTYLDNDDTRNLDDLTLRPNEGLIIAI